MRDLPSPAWPLLVLAVVQIADGLLCIRPARFVADCLRDVRFPRRYWRLLPLVKLAAAAGLILGTWVPYLGLLTCAALIAYFIVAISMHLRAHDLGRNLFVNAAGMLALCLAAPALAFLLLPPPAVPPSRSSWRDADQMAGPGGMCGRPGRRYASRLSRESRLVPSG